MDRGITLGILGLIVTRLMDVSTTLAGVSMGIPEGNPLVRVILWVFGLPGYVAFSGFVVVLTVVVIEVLRDEYVPPEKERLFYAGAYGLVCSWWFVVALVNARLLA